MENGSTEEEHLPPLKLYEVADVPYSMRVDNEITDKSKHRAPSSEASIIIDNGMW